MAYAKGVSGNKKGRPKGKKNKNSTQLRSTIISFLEDKFETVTQDFDLLKPNERVKFYCDLLQYGVPKLQATSARVDFNNCTDEQLDHIISELQNNFK